MSRRKCAKFDNIIDFSCNFDLVSFSISLVLIFLYAAALDVLDPDDDVPLTLINKQKTNKSATCHVPVEPIGEAGGKTLYRLSDQFEQLPEEDLESKVRHYNLSNAPFSSCYLPNL